MPFTDIASWAFPSNLKHSQRAMGDSWKALVLQCLEKE